MERPGTNWVGSPSLTLLFQNYGKLWGGKVNLAGARVGGRLGPVISLPWKSRRSVRVRPRVREASCVADKVGRRGIDGRESDFSAVKWSGRTGQGEGRGWRGSAEFSFDDGPGVW